MPLLSGRPQIETLLHSVGTDNRGGVRTEGGGQITHMRTERERLRRKREVKITQTFWTETVPPGCLVPGRIAV